jgi:hypothetical protein
VAAKGLGLKIAAGGGLALLTLAGAAQWLRAQDLEREREVWRALAATTRTQPPAFDPAMVADLPDPARRFFLFSIRPGTRLRTVAEIEMGGWIGLGSKEDPGYQPMRARQILASPHGLVWQVQAGSGLMAMTGSDAVFGRDAWTRFWLLKTLPIVRAGGDADFARSGAGRVVSEALFWTPAAFLPGSGARWEPVDQDTARAVVATPVETVAVELTVAPDGRPRSVLLQRWSNQNPEKAWRYQPFGGTIDEVGEFEGYRVATRVDGGNHFGSDAYFPFYRARVSSITYR